MKPKIVTKKIETKKGMNSSLNKPIIIAGPCSVENYEVMDKTSRFLKTLGVEYLRGGAYKPRTSPYSFQGLGIQGIDILKDIKAKYGLKIVSEIIDIRDFDEVLDVIDVIQIGSRNMYNYPLLKEAGKTNKKILLKRAMSATIEEWLNAAEYIALEGNTDIVLCERGIRTFETYTRNTFDINCIPVVKQKTNLKIIGDPSHGTGKSELIEAVSLATIAAGADGLIIELHPEPEKAVSDGFQSLNFEEFEKMYKKITKLYNFIAELNHEKTV
jgi:3-deoxy-7-phosphoheptulonate synthase